MSKKAGFDGQIDFGQDLTHEIIHEICLAIKFLEGGMELESMIGSFRDTLSDKDILIGLKEWNQNAERYVRGAELLKQLQRKAVSIKSQSNAR